MDGGGTLSGRIRIRGDSVPTWYPLTDLFLLGGQLIRSDSKEIDKPTWNDGIFLIDRAYGIDSQLVGALDPAVSAEERDTDRSDAFLVHGDLMFDDFTGIRQYEIVKGDL